MLSVTFGLAAFTMLCWQVGSDIGAVPGFPVFRGFLSQRYAWLFLAVCPCLFAGLIDVLAAHANPEFNPKSSAIAADELPADGLRQLVIAAE